MPSVRNLVLLAAIFAAPFAPALSVFLLLVAAAAWASRPGKRSRPGALVSLDGAPNATGAR